MLENQHEINNIGNLLLDTLQEAEIITESTNKLIKGRVKLMEAMTPETFDEEIVLEANTPKEVKTKDGIINYDAFKAIWLNYGEYPDPESVARALGFSRERLLTTKRDSIVQALRRIHSNFIDAGNQDAKTQLPEWGNRQAFYNRNFNTDPTPHEDSVPDASINDIDYGRRGRRTPSTRTLLAINDEEIVPGEFYNDISRIPKRAWGSWVRSWKKIGDKIKRFGHKIIGKKWQHFFIMGYQLDKKLVIEIWYNSATSKFYLYDQNGVELTSPTETLQETLRSFVTHLLRRGGQLDKDIFIGRSQISQEFARSYMTSLSNDLTKDKNAADRIASLLDKEADETGAAPPMGDAIKRAFKKGSSAASKYVGKGAQIYFDASLGAYAAAKPYVDELGDTIDSAGERAAQGLKKAHMDADDAIGKAYTKGKQYLISLYKSYDAYVADQYRREMRNAEQARKAMQAFEKAARNQRADEALKAIGIDSRIFNAYRAYADNEASMELLKKQDEIKRAYGEMVKAKLEVETIEAIPDSVIQKMGQKKEELKRKKKEQEERIRQELRRAAALMNEHDRMTQGDLGGSPFDSTQRRRRMNESYYVPDVEEFDAESIELDRRAISMRQFAQTSPATTMAIKSVLMNDMISTYSETRVDRKGGFKILGGLLGKKRAPGESRDWFDKIKMFFSGADYRADFVIGFSLRDQINIEIWYVTEPKTKMSSKMVSSFYVYDVTANKLIRANLPYYRNAVAVVMAKIGAQ